MRGIPDDAEFLGRAEQTSQELDDALRDEGIDPDDAASVKAALGDPATQARIVMRLGLTEEEAASAFAANRVTQAWFEALSTQVETLRSGLANVEAELRSVMDRKGVIDVGPENYAHMLGLAAARLDGYRKLSRIRGSLPEFVARAIFPPEAEDLPRLVDEMRGNLEDLRRQRHIAEAGMRSRRSARIETARELRADNAPEVRLCSACRRKPAKLDDLCKRCAHAAGVMPRGKIGSA